jgi:Mrp family chromosome partitioning ATPase
MVWKWAWLAVLAAGIAAGSSYFASKSITPLYRAQSTLMVGQIIQDPNLTSVSIYTTYQLANTYIQFVTREPVLQGAIDVLGLQMDWRSLAGRVSAYNVPQTQFIQVRVIDSDPYRAKVLADTIAQQLIQLSPANPTKIDEENAAFIRTQLDNLRENMQEGQTDRERLNIELSAATSARQIQDLKTQISALDARMSEWQANYTRLLSSLQGGNVNTLSLIEEASLPTTPFSPNVQQNVLVAAAIGAVLAIAGALLIEYLDDTVKSPEDISRLTGLTTIGGVPQISGDNYSTKLVAVHEPLSPIVEAFRILRTNLQFSAIDKPLRTLMVTSPNPSEGKSITICNLAVVMAQSGLRVALIDADLRRPTVHKIFDLPNNTGLTDAILQCTPQAAPEKRQPVAAAAAAASAAVPAAPRDLAHIFDDVSIESVAPRRTTSHTTSGLIADLEAYLQPTSLETLHVMTSGPLPPNPAELLGSGRMACLIHELQDHFDIVLFDSPPTLAVADAAILSTRVDGLILVNDIGRTRNSEARRAVEELRRVQAPLLGVVLNRLSRSGGSYNYYYYYYYRDGERQNRKSGGSFLGRLLPGKSNNNHRNGRPPSNPETSA